MMQAYSNTESDSVVTSNHRLQSYTFENELFYFYQVSWRYEYIVKRLITIKLKKMVNIIS